MKKILLSLLTLCAASTAMAQAFTPTPVTPPAGLKTTKMMANVTSESWNYTTENEVLVGYEGNDVYIQGLVGDFADAWLHGTLSGSTITFPQGQFLDYFGEEGYSYEMYACGFTGGGSQLCDFILERDEATGILAAPRGMGLGEFMEYYGSYYDLDKLTNITIAPISDEVGEATFIPADAVCKTYYLSGEDLRNGQTEYEATLAFEGEPTPGSEQAVYLGDFCMEANISGAAIKGYWSDEETLVFPSEQFMEHYTEEGSDPVDFYFYGAAIDPETGKVTTGDFILDYDANTGCFHSRFTGILISVGKITTSEITFAEFLQDVVLMPADDDVVGITSTTLPTANDAVYTLDGRRLPASLQPSTSSLYKGLIIKNGRISTTR